MVANQSSLAAAVDRFVVSDDIDYRAFFDSREAWARRRGLQMTLRHRWSGFAETFEHLGQQQAFGGYADPLQGFWISVDHEGRTIATYAAYIIPLIGNLREHVETRGWYPGARDVWRFVDGAADLAESLDDAIAFSGGIAVHPDYRRKGKRGALGLSGALSTELPMLGRILCYGLHAVRGNAFMIKPGIHTNLQNAMAERVEDGVEWLRWGSNYGPRRLLCWTSAQAAVGRAVLSPELLP